MNTAQSKRILDYLMTGASLTALDALNRFGTERLAARIYDIKNNKMLPDGYAIEKSMRKVHTRTGHATVAEYSIYRTDRTVVQTEKGSWEVFDETPTEIYGAPIQSKLF